MDAYRDSVAESIKEWFLRRYEDPAENTPYDSQEGGYIYIWGGPYDAREILEEQFPEEAEQGIIDQVVEELEDISLEWARIPTLEDIDPSDIASEFFERFQDSISSIRSELRKLSEGESPFMCSLLFAHTITCLEAYLYDAFVTHIKKDKYFRAFVESDPELKTEKLTVSEIFKKMESLQGDATKRIQSIVFHRLEVVQRMSKDTLGIDFPPGMKDLMPAISKRHDIVHRNCKDKDGHEFKVTPSEVDDLITLVSKFVEDLDITVRALDN